jgi:FSR family fosmidomycin resistance protein-like MFS transporter
MNHQGINFVFQICAYLLLIGTLTVSLPDVETDKD